jgi:O-antigen/teichoic acid export membrane protein
VGIGILLSALYFRIDAFLIEHWRGIEAVALYSAVFRIVDALRLFPGAVLAVALPTLCRATGFRVVRTLAVQLTLGAMAGASILWLVAPWLVPMLFGPAYAPAATTFRILLTAFPLMTLNYALTQQLVAWNGNRAFAACCAGALGVNLTINARAIPAWSIEGAAWATLATEIALTISCLGALVKRRRRLAGRGQTPHGLRGTENSPETAEARRKTGEFPLLRDSDSGAGSVFRSPERLRPGLLEDRWRQVGATWQEW